MLLEGEIVPLAPLTSALTVYCAMLKVAVTVQSAVTASVERPVLTQGELLDIPPAAPVAESTVADLDPEAPLGDAGTR